MYEFRLPLHIAKRKNSYISFLIIDIDHFKQYNDLYGHQMGDEVLVKVSQALQNTLHRANDYCFRLGGEEFGIVFINLDEEKSLQFSEKFRKNIESLKIKHEGNSANKFVTASFGLVCSKGSETEDLNTIYKKADDMLYKAKKNGRNKVCIV